MVGDILWTPPADLRQSTEVGRFMAWLAAHRGLHFSGYDELWRWSVDDLEGFWSAVWEFFGIRAHTPVRAGAGVARRCPARSGSPARA